MPGAGPCRRSGGERAGSSSNFWTPATDAVSATRSDGSRLYTETLNNMFDTRTSRVASLGNRVPTPVMILLVLGGAIPVVLAFYLTLLGKGLATSLITAAVVLIILFVSLRNCR